MIKSTEGLKFADILKNIRTSVRPKENGAAIRFIRQTRKGGGAVLIELDRETSNGASFSQAIEKAVGMTGLVRTFVPRVKLEVRDLDACTKRKR